MFNATFDDQEDRWKAAQFGDINKAADYFQALFLSNLSKGLEEIGYDITQNGKWFELAGVPRDLIEQFSRRRQKILDTAAERGITDPAEISKLAALKVAPSHGCSRVLPHCEHTRQA